MAHRSSWAAQARVLDVASPQVPPPLTKAPEEGSQIGKWPLRLQKGARGRHVTATRLLEAGECVFVEAAPIGQTVHDSFSELVCHCCYGPLPDGVAGGVAIGAGHPPSSDAAARSAAKSSKLGCDKCGGVFYCSQACADLFAATHATECEFVQQLRLAGVSADTATLRLYVRLLQTSHSNAAALSRIEQMQEHYDDCSAERRAALDTQADGLRQFLPPALHFDRARVARLIDRVHTNAFAVGDPAGETRGTGLYIDAGSYFNHSCDPTACVSFLGRTLRVHVLRDLKVGEEVSISYVELYAGRPARQAALRAKKGFDCTCERCVHPPANDLALDAWRCCAKRTCTAGCVAPDAVECGSCGSAHKLAPAARAALEARWRQSIDGWSQTLMGGGAAARSQSLKAAARELLPSVEEFLRTETAERLCETHVLRHRAFVLRSYAFALAGAPPAFLADAIEQCLLNMKRHLDHTSPNYLFFLHRLSGALARQADAETRAAKSTAGMRGADGLAARARAGDCRGGWAGDRVRGRPPVGGGVASGSRPAARRCVGAAEGL